MNVPDAAVEAAADALRRNGVIQSHSNAHVALHAAMPAMEKHIREALAQEIEDEGKEVVKWLADTRSDATDMGRLIGTEDAYKDAIRIVRGGTP